MNKTFRMTPDVVPYYGAVLVYGTLLATLLLVLQVIYVSYNARAVVDERGVSIEQTGFYNATVRYSDISELAIVPVDQESAYYPRRKQNGMDAHDGLVGWTLLANDQICLSLVARGHMEGVYLKDAEGTCYLLAVQDALGLLDVIERGVAGERVSETLYFPRVSGSSLYYLFVALIVGFLAISTFIFAGVRRYHKARVTATNQGLSIEKTGSWDAKIPYIAIKRVSSVPIGPDTAYYPMSGAWSHNHKSKVGQFVLPNGHTCTTLFSYAYDEGLYLETGDGTCYLLTVEKADQLLDLIERQMARLSTA